MMRDRTSGAGRGRPRTFDREAALEKAMLLFWEQGYDGVSIGTLCAELKLQPPSLYAAFGNKEQLFRAAVEHYAASRLGFIRAAIAEEPTAREAVARVLGDCAARYAGPEGPRGCLVASGGLRLSRDDQAIAAFLSERRNAARDQFAARIARAVADGELPGSVDPAALAGFYAAVIQGLSVQAIDGATPDALRAIAAMAIAAWPGAR